MTSAALVEELKRELKRKNVTYAELAKRVGLSEAAIKRAFALRNFSLQHLDQFCAAIDLDLKDLFAAIRRTDDQPQAFSDDIEDELAADPQLLLMLYLLLLRTPSAAIRKQLRTDKAGEYKLARRLERLGLIEVLPDDAIRVKVQKSIRWQKDGPLARRYAASIQAEFFASDFRGDREHQDFLTGALTPESYKIIQRKIAEVFQQFDELSDLDAATAEPRTEGFWFYAGIRPWDPLAVIQRSSR